MRPWIPFLSMTLLASGAAAQRVSMGVMLGGYGGADFYSYYTPMPPFPPSIVESRAGGPVAGPALEIRLTPKLGIGAEALYKRLRYRASATYGPDGTVIGYAPATVVTWQVPVLVRYRFGLGPARPFLEGGPSFRVAGNLNSSNPSRAGATAGAGVEFAWGALRVAPRVRYTRWAADPARGVRTRPDQVEFLAGVSYGAGSTVAPLGSRVSLGVVLISHAAGEIRPSIWESVGEDRVTVWRNVSDPRGPALGPLIEVSLGRGFAVAAAAFPRTFRSTARAVNPDESEPFTQYGLSGETNATWDIPVWVKYRVAAGSWRPFVAAGPAFRLPKEVGVWLSNTGATAGAGIEVRAGRFRVEPALRYTHWGRGRPRVPGGTMISDVRRNELQVSVGVATLAREGDVDGALPAAIRLGAVLATPLTGEFRENPMAASAPRGPALGPLVEISLTPRWSVEGSAVRRRFRAVRPIAGEHFPFEASWEFPLAAKYRLATGALRPFLTAGPSFREATQAGSARLSRCGASAGAGLEFDWRGVAVSPALRYTHWAKDTSRVYSNQLQLVVSFSFRSRRGSM